MNMFDDEKITQGSGGDDFGESTPEEEAVQPEQIEESREVEVEAEEEVEEEQEAIGSQEQNCPPGIFKNVEEESFYNLTKVFKRQIRDYKFFLKFQKYAPVTHFVDRPEKFANTYEKHYWNLTFFNRLCLSIRKMAKHLATAPFSPEGEYAMFEKEVLNSPQTCPIYVERSRSIMESNLKRFKRVLYVTHRDVHTTSELYGNIAEDDHASSIQLGRFLKKGKTPRFVEDSDSTPTTEIDRHSWPQMIETSDVR